MLIDVLVDAVDTEPSLDCFNHQFRVVISRQTVTNHLRPVLDTQVTTDEFPRKPIQGTIRLHDYPLLFEVDRGHQSV